MNAALKDILLDDSSGILLLVDPSSLAIVTASDSTLELLGYRREQFLGRPITEIEFGLADVCFWQETLHGGPLEVRGIETSYLCASGETLLATKSVTRLARGDRVWLVVRAEPLARQRNEEELARSMSCLRGTLEATAEGILLVDCDRRIINMNSRFARIWNMPVSLLIEHDDEQIFDFMARLMAEPTVYRDRLAAISSEVDDESFDVLDLADGRIIERRSAPARNAGQVFGRVYSYTDITERRRNEAARVQLEAQLRESQKMEALGTLAGGVAHDFNNILATIVGNVELAFQDVGPGHAALESLAEIRKASRRAKDLVRQILTFGRRQAIERAVISLEPVVRDSARFLSAILPAGVTLRVECAREVPAVLADANQVQQVLLNLCNNAWQAVQGHKLQGVITVCLEQRVVNDAPDTRVERASGDQGIALRPGRYTCLSVSDNGCGMDPATRARIFEPFFTTKPVGEGTGLGLSVVHSIVKDHGANIEVRSGPGNGATFSVYFPALEVSDPPLQASRAAPGAPNERVARDEPAPLSPTQGTHILYVDDDESIIFLMTRLLQRQGYRVSSYTNPRAAVAAMREPNARFDLAITDYNMPGMSGIEVVLALRAIRPDMPIALASGYISDDVRARVLAAGASEIIYKPDSVDELCAAVARLAASLRRTQTG